MSTTSPGLRPSTLESSWTPNSPASSPCERQARTLRGTETRPRHLLSLTDMGPPEAPGGDRDPFRQFNGTLEPGRRTLGSRGRQVHLLSCLPRFSGAPTGSFGTCRGRERRRRVRLLPTLGKDWRRTAVKDRETPFRVLICGEPQINESRLLVSLVTTALEDRLRKY